MAKKKRKNKVKKLDDILLVIGASYKINTGFAQVTRMMLEFGCKSNKFKRVVGISYNTPTDEDTKFTDNKLPDAVEVHEEPMTSSTYGSNILMDILPKLIKEGRVYVITVGDPWNFYYMEQVAGLENLIWMPYIPVESQMPTTIVSATNSTHVSISLPTLYSRADLPIAYSRFGMRELNKSGIKCEDWLYHMIDVDKTRAYSKTPKSNKVKDIIRDIAGDATIIGTVCANAYRKGLDLIISTVAELVHKRNKNVLLLLHTPRGKGKSNVTQLDHLIREFDIPAIITTDLISVPKKEGGRVTIFGYDNETLDGIMRSIDIYINMSRAEGFGIPIIEATARGTDVLVSDCCTMGEIARVLGPDVHLIDVDDHQASFTGTNQLLFQPSIGSAADIIDKIISDKEKKHPEYNMIAFDTGDPSGQYLFNIIVDKAKKIQKKTSKVIINFGGLLSNGEDGAYVINAVQAGVKHYDNVDFVLNTYKDMPVDALLDTMSIHNTLGKSYAGLLVRHTELFTERMRNVYNLSNIMAEYKYEGSNVIHALPSGVEPHGRYSNMLNFNTEDNITEADIAVILISTTGRSGSNLLSFIENNKDIIKDKNVIYSTLDFYAETSTLFNTSIIHARSSGMKYVPFDKLSNVKVKYVLLPYNLRLDALGRYLLDKVSKMKPEKILINSVNPGTVLPGEIVELHNNSKYVQMYGAWKRSREVFNPSSYLSSSSQLPKDLKVDGGSS